MNTDTMLLTVIATTIVVLAIWLIFITAWIDKHLLALRISLNEYRIWCMDTFGDEEAE